MWSPFRKRDKKNGPSGPKDHPQTNIIDALANKLHHEGRIDDLEQELEKVNQSSLSEAGKSLGGIYTASRHFTLAEMRKLRLDLKKG